MDSSKIILIGMAGTLISLLIFIILEKCLVDKTPKLVKEVRTYVTRQFAEAYKLTDTNKDTINNLIQEHRPNYRIAATYTDREQLIIVWESVTAGVDGSTGVDESTGVNKSSLGRYAESSN